VRKATFKEVQKVILDLPGKVHLFHNPAKCLTGQMGSVELERVDPLDFVKHDELVCRGCNHSMALHWFMTEEYAEWIEENYVVDLAIACECGSAKIGIKPYKPGHSWWCPVVVP